MLGVLFIHVSIFFLVYFKLPFNVMLDKSWRLSEILQNGRVSIGFIYSSHVTIKLPLVYWPQSVTRCAGAVVCVASKGGKALPPDLQPGLLEVGWGGH